MLGHATAIAANAAVIVRDDAEDLIAAIDATTDRREISGDDVERLLLDRVADEAAEQDLLERISNQLAYLIRTAKMHNQRLNRLEAAAEVK